MKVAKDFLAKKKSTKRLKVYKRGLPNIARNTLITFSYGAFPITFEAISN